MEQQHSITAEIEFKVAKQASRLLINGMLRLGTLSVHRTLVLDYLSTRFDISQDNEGIILLDYISAVNVIATGYNELIKSKELSMKVISISDRFGEDIGTSSIHPLDWRDNSQKYAMFSTSVEDITGALGTLFRLSLIKNIDKILLDSYKRIIPQ